MQAYPQIELEVALIDRVVDIVEEGYDMAIRISRVGSASHAARKLATSTNICCAAPAYLQQHGTPQVPADLTAHRCIGYRYAATADEWSFISAGRSRAVRWRLAGTVMPTLCKPSSWCRRA